MYLVRELASVPWLSKGSLKANPTKVPEVSHEAEDELVMPRFVLPVTPVQGVLLSRNSSKEAFAKLGAALPTRPTRQPTTTSWFR